VKFITSVSLNWKEQGDVTSDKWQVEMHSEIIGGCDFIHRSLFFLFYR